MWIRSRTLFAACFLAAVLSALMGCSAGTPNTPVSLRGAGATAPYLVYSESVKAYRKVEPRVNLQYEPTGSGAGIQALKAQTVDFAASDMPLTDEEIGMMAVKPLHFPTLVGAIVPVYNVPNVGTLNFTGAVLAGIFSGRIRSWNDRALVQLNPSTALPASPSTSWCTQRKPADRRTHLPITFPRLARCGKRISGAARRFRGQPERLRPEIRPWPSW